MSVIWSVVLFPTAALENTSRLKVNAFLRKSNMEHLDCKIFGVLHNSPGRNSNERYIAPKSSPSFA
jgi:hypothetical protein